MSKLVAKKRGRNRTLKVYGGTTTVNGVRYQLLVAASSYEHVAKLIKASLNRVRYSFVESFGGMAKRILDEKREGVWQRGVADYTGLYVEMK